MEILDDKGYKWESIQAEAQGSPVIDEERGQDRVIRCFSYLLDPTKDFIPEEVINGNRRAIEDNLWKDGWVLAKDLEIMKRNDSQCVILAVAKPAVKHGTIIGATNDKAIGAGDGLRKSK